MLDTLVESGVRTSTISTHGGSYLVKVTQVASQGGSWHVITAINNDAQVSVLNQVALLLIASIAGINLAFGAASWLIGSAALSPVARLRRSAAELVSRPGRELLPVGPAQDEIAELASTLNELIGQLRTSAERERQVVSDASHEFRTPLAIMRTQLELAQAEASSIEQMRADVTAVQVTLARLITLATSLLELSRIDAQATPGTAGVDQLAVELANAADRGRQRVGGRDIRVEYVPLVSADDKRQVAVAAPDFGRVCDNLVSNSLTALGQAGVIELVLDSSDDGLVLSISDDAGGMDPAFVDHAFDRFSRPDSARTGSGAGLGLAIVDGIATVAGGTVRLVNRPGEGLTVITTFPFAAPQHGSDP
jgi:signal transduction histidine kinase